jgi:hypothetical protein
VKVIDGVSSRPYIGVSTGVRSSSLLIAEGGDELAAEGGDVWDHAAPDQVGSDRDLSEYASNGPLHRARACLPPPVGVFAGVNREVREKLASRRVAPTAFKLAHASWDNALRGFSRGGRPLWCGGDGDRRMMVARGNESARGYCQPASSSRVEPWPRVCRLDESSTDPGIGGKV